MTLFNTRLFDKVRDVKMKCMSKSQMHFMYFIHTILQNCSLLHSTQVLHIF